MPQISSRMALEYPVHPSVAIQPIFKLYKFNKLLLEFNNFLPGLEATKEKATFQIRISGMELHDLHTSI